MLLGIEQNEHIPPYKYAYLRKTDSLFHKIDKALNLFRKMLQKT